MMQPSFIEELRVLINRHSRENDSDTPDHILSEYLSACLDAFEQGVRMRDKWYGIETRKEFDL